MKKFRVVIKFRTPYITPFQSDTIFGEFCWHYRFLFGERLLKVLEKPVIAFSDLFPLGELPFPKYPYHNQFRSLASYGLVKRLKKRKTISIDILSRALRDTSSFEEFIQHLYWLVIEEERKRSGQTKEEKYEERCTTVRVAINRQTLTAADGRLYNISERFVPKDKPFVIYGIYDERTLDWIDIKKTFSFLSLNGFGAKKSSGKGKFEIVAIEKKWELPERGQSWFISLSTGLPEKEEIDNYYADFFTKFPKHGREVAKASVFKNPLILAKPGSMFEAAEKKDIYGSLVGISSLPGHKHSRLIVPLFVG